jgi:hypothetical protein
VLVEQEEIQQALMLSQVWLSGVVDFGCVA